MLRHINEVTLAARPDVSTHHPTSLLRLVCEKRDQLFERELKEFGRPTTTPRWRAGNKTAR